MLELTGLTVRFGGVRPLVDVSLRLAPGIAGLIGPNGAGKTTLFNVLSGFVVPAAGTVRADGADLLALRPHRRAGWGLRRTFQQDQLVGDLSARDNLRLAADHLGAGPPDLLELVGLAEPDRPAATLPLAQRRRLELARTLVGRPRLVLLDEPSAGMSSAETAAFGELLRQLPERFGALVVLIEHDLDLVAQVCATAAVLDFGRLLAVGGTAEVLADPAVRRAYLGQEEAG